MVDGLTEKGGGEMGLAACFSFLRGELSLGRLVKAGCRRYVAVARYLDE